MKRSRVPAYMLNRLFGMTKPKRPVIPAVCTGSFEDYMQSLPDGSVVEVDRGIINSLPEGTPIWVDEANQYYVYRNGVKVSLADVVLLR